MLRLARKLDVTPINLSCSGHRVYFSSRNTSLTRIKAQNNPFITTWKGYNYHVIGLAVQPHTDREMLLQTTSKSNKNPQHAFACRQKVMIDDNVFVSVLSLSKEPLKYRSMRFLLKQKEVFTFYCRSTLVFVYTDGTSWVCLTFCCLFKNPLSQKTRAVLMGQVMCKNSRERQLLTF